MRYSSSTWKHKLRKYFYKKIPPKLYIAIMTKYLKIFNKKRRGGNFSFNVGENESIILHDDKIRFYFVGYRRINRYLYSDGLERIKNSMKNKYCISNCDIEPGDVVVEIGANVGEFTLVAAEHAKKVYAFEPDPNCFFCLEKNTNSIENIEVIEKGVSNADKKELFYLSSDDADSSIIKPKVYDNALKLNFIRLDSWINSNNISKIDFLKIEAEGAEMEVLEGLGNKIECVEKISIDGGPECYGEPTTDNVNHFLQSKGFKTRIIKHLVYAWKK